MLEVVVLVGLQASGKTAFYRRHLSSCVHVSKDNWPNTRRKSSRQMREIGNALTAGRSVAVDNTNPTIEDRCPLVEAAKAHDASAIAFFFEASVRECLARNAQREGRARVPDVAILATAKRLQPPVAEEGFQRLHRVRLTTEGKFIVNDQLNRPTAGVSNDETASGRISRHAKPMSDGGGAEHTSGYDRRMSTQRTAFEGTAPPTTAEIEAEIRAEGLTPQTWSNGPGVRYGWHEHRYHKRLHCTAGSIVFHTRNGDYELEPGDRLDLTPGTAHAATVGPDGVTCVEVAL